MLVICVYSFFLPRVLSVSSFFFFILVSRCLHRRILGSFFGGRVFTLRFSENFRSVVLYFSSLLEIPIDYFV